MATSGPFFACPRRRPAWRAFGPKARARLDRKPPAGHVCETVAVLPGPAGGRGEGDRGPAFRFFRRKIDQMDADAAVRFGSTRDRMKVGVSRYTPAQGQGRPLSVELLAKALAEAGIVVPLDQKNAAEAVALLLAGKDASRIVLARGVRPTLGRDAWVDPVGDWSLPVFPGMAFGRLHPARLPADGMDVAGNPVPPETPHKPR